MLNWQCKRTPIGLDIGARGVRAVQLTRAGDGYVVSSAAAHEGSHAGSDDVDQAQRLTTHIQGCVQEATFRGGNAVAMLNPPAVEFHTLELPPAVLTSRDASTAQVVRWEVGRMTNEPIDDIETGHWPLPPTKVSAPNAIGLAVRRERVSQTLASCARAGLRCTGIDVGAAALARLGTILHAWNSEEVWGMLDIGYEEARLLLCVDEVPVLVRRAGSGGQAWTTRIADSLQVSVNSAEVHKREHGIALTSRGLRKGPQDPPAGEVASILLGTLRGELKDLASEVKRSYEYVLGCYPSRHAADLMLVGGGATMPNLAEFLTSVLGIPVRPACDYLGNEHCRLHYAVDDSSAHRAGGVRVEVLASAIGLVIGAEMTNGK